MINSSLAGDALLHCLKLGDSKYLLVDQDEACQQRINEVIDKVKETGNDIIVMNKQKRSEIAAFEPRRPE